MKNHKLRVLAVAFVSLLAVMSCKSNTEEKEANLEKANEEVIIAQNELTAARMDSINEYAKYRAKMDAKLLENDKQIAEIRAKNKLQKAEIRAKLDKNLDALMQKNEEFKIEIRNQKDGIYSDWEGFKDSFNENLDDFGKSISNLAQENNKKE